MKQITIKHVQKALVQDDPQRMGKIVLAYGEEIMDASDGYHTFTELYDHRITLFIALCKQYTFLNAVAPRMMKESINVMNKEDVAPGTITLELRNHPVWRSQKHHLGGSPMYEGWFILGIGKETGSQISYHLPMSVWNDTEFAETLENAPVWDGHSPEDVLKRVKML